ncbi:MAG TPA: hypothetical protein VJJ77_04785, partial [Dongiaceae bacterium]|nr:hypothetical protein [Dongiaceae bacterium]
PVETASATEREPTRRHRVRRPRRAPAATETGPEPALAAAASADREPSRSEPRHRGPAEGAAPDERGGNGAARGDVAPEPAETSETSAGSEARRGWWRRLVE